MDDDRLLEEFARLARKEEREEDRFPGAKLAHGTLPPEEEERWRAEGAESEEARAAYEVFRPLGAEFRARMAEELRDRVGRPGPAAFPARVRRRWWPRLAAAAAIVAGAAGLVWLRPTPELHPLPRFELELQGAARERSGTDTAVLVPGSTFRVLLRPESTASGRIDARFFVARGDEWREWPLEATVAPTGALRADRRLEGELALAPGVWTLVAAVGRRRDLAPSGEIRRRFESGADAPSGGWQLIVTSFQVEHPEQRSFPP